jgi:tetratricopeptide (TPR) repeat protein
LRALLSFLLPLGLLAQTQLQDAVSLTRAGHYKEARAKLVQVPEPSEIPQRIAFHRLKAVIASGLGDGQAAAAEMQTALRLAPSDGGLLTGAAMAEQQIGHLDQALSLAQKAGENAAAKAIIGDIQENRGRFNESVDAYRQAVALDPSREQYRVMLGLEFIRHGAFEQAADLLRQSSWLFPKSGVTLTLLAIAVYAAGELKESEETLQRAIAADPGYDPAYQCLSKIVLESSALPSEETMSALCRWDQTVCGALQLRVARESGDEKLGDGAIEVLARAPQNDAVARCALGQTYEWKKQMVKARSEMEACVALHPTPQNHYRLGLLYQRLGETVLARKQFEARTELLRNMSEETATVLSALQFIPKKP